VQVRFRGYLDNPNTLGMICFVSLPLFLYKYKTAFSKKKQIIPMSLIITSVTLPVIAFSRASVLGIILILAVYFYYYNRRIFVAGLIFSLVVVIVIVSSPLLLELLRLADDPLSQRDKVWELGMKAWNEHILFGAGYGTTHIVTSDKYTFLQKGITEFLLGKHFNNIYLEILYETGIIGILLFLLVLIFVITETIQKIKHADGDRKIFNVCYYSVLIAVIFQSFFESFILSAGNASSIIFWTMTGLVISARKAGNKKL
jgi:O-antigen ligase